MKGIIILFTVVVVISGSISSLAFYARSIQCKSAYENYQPEWGIISGCRIVVGGKLTPVDIVRELN